MPFRYNLAVIQKPMAVRYILGMDISYPGVQECIVTFFETRERIIGTPSSKFDGLLDRLNRTILGN